MATCSFNHVRICDVKTVVPEHFIDFDDEIQYYDNNPKKLARQKKMNGYGRRYIADEKTTVTDMACFAAEKLLAEMSVAREDIDLLVFVNQLPDYVEPCDACLAHGRLGLKRECASIDLNHGCTGYVNALMTTHALMSSGGYKTGLVLAGDLPARTNDQANRKNAPVFGDAASATILKYTDEDCTATFVTGTDGKGWDRIVRPAGGTALPIDHKILDLMIQDDLGNTYSLISGAMKGEDVFNFTMEVVPKLIADTMSAASWSVQDVDAFAIHQAKKQIVDMIVDKCGIPANKASAETFSRYANNSTNSVVTVICDQFKSKPVKNVVLATFGVGLSWAGAAVDLSKLYNGGVDIYTTPSDALNSEARVAYWVKQFGGAQ